jgi:recombinational DNA repair ATPase RecF
MDGQTIRSFFRELFGSRLVAHLETELLRLRQDYEVRLQDKDEMIAQLRTEKAVLDGKIILYERTIMPLASRAGADVVSRTKTTPRPIFTDKDFINKPYMSRWEQVQTEHEKELAELQDQEKSKAKGA